MSKIQQDSKTWDVLRASEYIYYIRNDLALSKAIALRYKSGSSAKPDIIDVCATLSGGIAYMGLGGDTKYKYCIKGDKWHRVSDLSTGASYKSGDLHKDFKNGDYYFQRDSKFYVIKGRNFGYASSYSKEIKSWYPLNDKIKNILAIYGNGDRYYILTQVDNQVIQYRITSLQKFSDYKENVVAMDKVMFMPGGPSLIIGPMKSKWQKLSPVQRDDGQYLEYDSGAAKETYSAASAWVNKTADKLNLSSLLMQAEIARTSEFGGQGLVNSKSVWNQESKSIRLSPAQLKNNNFYRLKTGYKGAESQANGGYLLLGSKCIASSTEPNLDEQMRASYYTASRSENQLIGDREPLSPEDTMDELSDEILEAMNLYVPQALANAGLDPWPVVASDKESISFHLVIPAVKDPFLGITIIPKIDCGTVTASVSYSIKNLCGLSSLVTNSLELGELDISAPDSDGSQKVTGSGELKATLPVDITAKVSGNASASYKDPYLGITVPISESVSGSIKASGCKGSGQCSFEATLTSVNGCFKKLVINNFKLKYKDISIKISGLGLLNPIIEPLTSEISKLFKSEIENELSQLVKTELNKVIKNEVLPFCIDRTA